MKHKTAELEGPLLDAAVAKAEELEWSTAIEGADGACSVKRLGGGIGGPGRAWFLYRPSTEWQHGGEIIDREWIEFRESSAQRLCASIFSTEARAAHGHGPTHLIAGMRAYLTWKFGEEVEL